MRWLALETSAGSVSCAVVEEERILGRASLRVGLTHSQTLLPLCEALLHSAGVSLDSIEAMAVAAGPGSYTGVRIGVAALKGLAFPRRTPCVGVSTLAAMAQNIRKLPFSGLVCGAMDARCQQIYTARFVCRNGEISRQTPDEARPIEEVGEEWKTCQEPILLVGDGAALCYETLAGRVPGLRLAPEELRYQDAVGVAREAQRVYAEEGAVPPEKLMPLYLRLPQAQRELQARQAAERQT